MEADEPSAPRPHLYLMRLVSHREEKKASGNAGFLGWFCLFLKKSAFRLHLSTSAPAKTPREGQNALVYTGCTTFFRTMGRRREEHPLLGKKTPSMRGALGEPRSAFSSAIIAAMNLSENITLLHGECTELLSQIPDSSIDAIITDPPYGYLKNQKLDIPFNETVFFNEAKRVLKPSGFILLFGRGTAFYRWNTILADLGFVFKEEIIWNKVQTTSPVLPLSRVHETVSIHCKGKGKIKKVRVPYLEMKGHDIGAIKQDIKRLMSVFSNNKSLAAVMAYLETAERNYIEPISTKNNNMLFSKKVKGDDRAVRVTACMKDGLKEKSIIQTPSYDKEAKAKYFTSHTGIINGCDRDVAVIDIITRGLREKSIMQQGREHYTMQHPTQKPVRLLERLMALVTQENDSVLDPFMGSASTGVACINTDRKFIGMELADEYFNLAKQRLATALQEKGIL